MVTSLLTTYYPSLMLVQATYLLPRPPFRVFDLSHDFYVCLFSIFGFFHFLIFLLNDVASIELSPMLKHCIVLNVMKDKRIEAYGKAKNNSQTSPSCLDTSCVAGGLLNKCPGLWCWTGVFINSVIFSYRATIRNHFGE